MGQCDASKLGPRRLNERLSLRHISNQLVIKQMNMTVILRPKIAQLNINKG